MRLAVNFSDIIKADHKMLNVEDESRNVHWCVIGGIDAATQWILSYPDKNESITRNDEERTEIS